MKTIRSHKYLAESILNRFAEPDDNNRKIIYYIDFEDNKIKSTTTSSFNKEEGYYTEENEGNLKRVSEEKIGNVISELQRKHEKNGINFNISIKSKQIIKKYVSYQLIRDDSMVEYIINFFANLDCEKYYLSNEELNRLKELKRCYSNITVKQLKNRLIETEEETEMFFEPVSNLGIIILFNMTNRKFVLTSSTSALNPYSPGHFIMHITLTPEINIALCNKKSLKSYLEIDRNIYLSEIRDKEFILEYNKGLFEVAKKNKPHKIVGFKRDLEELINKEK